MAVGPRSSARYWSRGTSTAEAEERDLGRLRQARVTLDDSGRPWALPSADTLVVSAGGGLGLLARAAQARFPAAAWGTVDVVRLAPESPVVLPVQDDSTALQRIVLASVRSPSSHGAGAPSVAHVRSATRSAIEAAVAAGAVAVATPLLGAGAVGLSPWLVAFEMLLTIEGMMRVDGDLPLHRLTFVCRDESARRAIEHVWEYHELLVETKERVLDDPGTRQAASRAGLTVASLRAALDVDEADLWDPCSSELANLRRLDDALDDLRAVATRALSSVHASSGSGALAPRPGADLAATLAPDEVGALEATLEVDPQWRDLDASRTAALARLRAQVRTESLLPRIRQAINRGRRHADGRPSDLDEYQRQLGKVDPSGLRGEPKPSSLITTAAHDDLRRLMDPGHSARASVGVAGPRGSGKSTLLHEAAADGGLPGLHIFESAPASYVSRDFLLHLYGEVCEAVLRTDPDPRVRASVDAPTTAPLRRTIAIRLVALPALAAVVGLTAVASSTAWRSADGAALVSAGASLVVASVASSVGLLWSALDRHPRRWLQHTRDEADARLSALTWHERSFVWLVVLVGVVGVLVVLAGRGTLSVQQATGAGLVLVACVPALARLRLGGGGGDRTRPADAAGDGAPPTTRTAGGAAGTTALTLRTGLAVKACALAAVVAAQVAALAYGLAFLLRAPLAAPVDVALVLGVVTSAAAIAACARGWRWRVRLTTELAEDAAPWRDPYTAVARRELTRIRRQRSVSAGWTSSVKVSAGGWLPFGADAGVSGSTTESDVPLTVPDIVKGIQRLLPCRGAAVLAIDELDKIESDQDARDFLNEIKGLLETPGTRCLVSMSEDAIARFERRGLPFRDVFDSAFDDVIRVPYLCAAQARTLLDQRVTDVPEPFLALAYCLSGGLPRDLLRATERITTLSRDGLPTTLADAARLTVHRDLHAKTDAVCAAMTALAVEPDVSALLRSARRVDTCDAVAGAGRCLLDDDWLADVCALAPIIPAGTTGDVDERRKLLRLGTELFGYLLYSRTLLELFRTTTPYEAERLVTLARTDKGAALDALCRARQTFAVSPTIAWEDLTGTRRAAGLATFDLPTPFVVGA